MRLHSLPVRGLVYACALLLMLPGLACAGGARTYRHQLLRAINAARAANGLAPLRLERHLALAARRYSHVLARTGLLTHEARGHGVVERVHSAGYRGDHIGEDLAVGMTADATVQAWLASPPHRAVMLSPSFHVLGIGVSNGSFAGAPARWVTADLGG